MTDEPKPAVPGMLITEGDCPSTTNQALSLREEIARIIDAYAWQTGDQINWNNDSPSARSLQQQVRGWKDASLAKADAILAFSDERIRTLEAAISWALGEGHSDFGDYEAPNSPRYWWRNELRRRAALGQLGERDGE